MGQSRVPWSVVRRSITERAAGAQTLNSQVPSLRLAPGILVSILLNMRLFTYLESDATTPEDASPGKTSSDFSFVFAAPAGVAARSGGRLSGRSRAYQ